MEKNGIRRREKLYISSTNRTSGTLTDFYVSFPPIDNVVAIEWASQFHLGDQKLASIDGYNSSRHTNGMMFWRVLDAITNQRTAAMNWEAFPEDSVKRRLNNLHIKLYDVSGAPTSPGDAFVSDPWGIELDLYVID
jgi:hypothetical protein